MKISNMEYLTVENPPRVTHASNIPYLHYTYRWCERHVRKCPFTVHARMHARISRLSQLMKHLSSCATCVLRFGTIDHFPLPWTNFGERERAPRFEPLHILADKTTSRIFHDLTSRSRTTRRIRNAITILSLYPHAEKRKRELPSLLHQHT